MLYIKSFKNYDEFKNIFAIVEHGNGVKSRKNKILLGCLKDRRFVHWWMQFREMAIRNGCDKITDFLEMKDMVELKRFFQILLASYAYTEAVWSERDDIATLKNFVLPNWTLRSKTLHVDAKGLCEDGDTKCIRYENTENERIFKMKAGKFISRCIEDIYGTSIMPEQAKRWLGEEFAADWEIYAKSEIGETKNLTLCVGDSVRDFEDIYDGDECVGSFGSCMTDENQSDFYCQSVIASAACLKNADGKIVARCIIFDDVYDENGKAWRLAERQYATEQNDLLKRILVEKLIEADRIDGYKKVGVDCHDNRNFIAVNGDSLRDKKFCIKCSLEDGDTLSYQDSFVYYDYKMNEAYNYPAMGYTDKLDTTNSSFERSHNNEEWSDVYNEYIDADDAVWDEYNQVYIREEDAVPASYRGYHIQLCQYKTCDFCWSNTEDEYIHKDECVHIDSIDDYVYNDDAVEDINGDYQLADDCVWSHYEQKHILKEDSVHSDYEDDNLFKDTSVYSELLKDWFGDEDDRIEEEKEHRKNHALMCIA